MVERRVVRKQRKTLLVVGEGKTEVAFLSYLRSLYCRDGAGAHVTVKDAHGKGPENVLDTAVGMKRGTSYDQLAAVLDTDIPWTDKLKNEARNQQVELIGNSPCIEALFLRVLGLNVPRSTSQCKRAIYTRLGVNLTDKNNYEGWCNKDNLDVLSSSEPELAKLIELYKGNF